MLPPPWKTWWAFIGYTIFIMMLFWLGVRTVDSYAQRRATRKLETQMHDNEERAYDELQEQFELHDTLARTSHDHSENTLHRIFHNHVEPYRANPLSSGACGQSMATLFRPVCGSNRCEWHRVNGDRFQDRAWPELYS